MFVLIDDGPVSSFPGRSSSASSFHRLSPQDDRWCDVLDSVPAYSVSNSSTLQIFLDASHLQCLLCLPVLSGNFESHRHVQCSTPTGVFGGGDRPLTNSRLGFPFHISLFVAASSLNLWRMVACVVWLSWGKPVEGMRDFFHFHCRAEV